MKDICVARQPIFDSRRDLVAYELMYRADSAVATAGGVSGSTMSSSVIVDGVLGVGLTTLTDGRTAFINFTEEVLLEGAAAFLDPSAVVIEILESVQPTPEVIATCTALVEQGYQLALDDFLFDPAYAPLLELAHIVKVDVLASAHNLEELVAQLAPFGVRLLAEKVENAEVHDRCVALGFELFQGFHYFRPETLTKKDMAAQKTAIIRLVNLVGDPTATDRRIEEAFRSDPSLTFKLLRLVNSAAMGGRGIQSISHALQLLGRDPLYRWLCLLLMTVGAGDTGMALEMIKDALVRARMCEAAGDCIRSSVHRDIPDGGALFLVGLFSMIDQILGIPVEELLAQVDVSPDVQNALIRGDGKAARILGSVTAYAEAEWDRADTEIASAGGDPAILWEIYLDSLAWANARLAFQDT